MCAWIHVEIAPPAFTGDIAHCTLRVSSTLADAKPAAIAASYWHSPGEAWAERWPSGRPRPTPSALAPAHTWRRTAGPAYPWSAHTSTCSPACLWVGTPSQSSRDSLSRWIWRPALQRPSAVDKRTCTRQRRSAWRCSQRLVLIDILPTQNQCKSDRHG